MSKIDVFLRWLEANGARFPKLAIQHHEGEERGVLAVHAIAPGEPVLTIPRRAILTVADARSSALGRRIAASGQRGAADDVYLAAYLLDERQSGGSFWKPYLDILPDAFPTNALFFDERDRSLLEGSFLVEATAERRRVLLEDHASLAGAVPELGWIQPSDFVWARVAVSSRNFGLTIDGAKLRCLVPMADMLNHRPSPETSWAYAQELGAFAMIAVTEVPSGAPVHDSYGVKCNSRFLLNYGFTLDDNDDNHAVVRARLPGDAPFVDVKRKILGLGPGESSRSFKVPAGPGDRTSDLLSFLRIACADGPELAALCPAPGFAARAGAPLSAAAEERALRLLDAACAEALARFPTTLQEDDALLRSGYLRGNARSAVVMRRGEKQVLSAYRELCRACIPLLRMPLHLVAPAAASLPAAPAPLRGYLEDVVVGAVRDDAWSVLERAARRPRGSGKLLERTAAWRSPPS